MTDDERFAELARRVVPNGRLLRYWPLSGGVSAVMHALEIAAPDGDLRRLVSRRHRNADWKPLEQDVTATEFALLTVLRDRGVAVPEPCWLDSAGEIWPTPSFVMELVEGTTAVDDAELPEALRQMAAFLARLHALDVEPPTDLPALPEREDPRAGLLDYLPASAWSDRLRTALESQAIDGPENSPCLLHGDFWPGNILWRDGQIAAVVDWEDAALGDPVSDLACTRVEVLCEYDEVAMDLLTTHYRELMDVDTLSLPLWDAYVSAAALASMAHWGLDLEVEAERRRRTLWHMERAVHELLDGGR